MDRPTAMNSGSTSQCVATRSATTVMEDESPMLGAEDQVSSGVVRLKLNKAQRDKKVKWTNDTVDNEHLGRKKSKCCCVYVPPKAFDESSSEESEMECEHCSGHVEKRNKEPSSTEKKEEDKISGE